MADCASPTCATPDAVSRVTIGPLAPGGEAIELCGTCFALWTDGADPAKLCASLLAHEERSAGEGRPARESARTGPQRATAGPSWEARR